MKEKSDKSADAPDWQEAMATVTSCHYEFGAGQALAFGIPMTNHFSISYNYFAGDQLCSGQFSSSHPVPQGHLFPVRYNPADPTENVRSIT